MRALLLLVATGCGRFGFGDGTPPDAASTFDAASIDGVRIDAADSFVLAGIVARYPMNDDPGTGAIGSPQLPAACAPCPTSAAGKHDGGYRFDGTVWFELPSTTLVGVAPYSVAVWFKLASYAGVGGGRSIVNKPLDPTTALNVFNLVVIDNGTASMESTAGTSNDYASSPTITSLDTWHHLVATWDGTTKRLYEDGTLQAATAAAITDSAEPIRIGADRDYGNALYFFDGVLDELQFYGRVLSDPEIAGLAAQ